MRYWQPVISIVLHNASWLLTTSLGRLAVDTSEGYTNGKKAFFESETDIATILENNTAVSLLQYDSLICSSVYPFNFKASPFGFAALM